MRLIDADKLKEQIAEKSFIEEIFDEDEFNSMYSENYTREVAEAESCIETSLVKVDDMFELIDKATSVVECSDAISRKECMDNYNSVETPVGYRKVVDMDVIENMQPVKPIAQWIPVEERLPSDNEGHEVLGCNKLGYMMIGYIFKDNSGEFGETGFAMESELNYLEDLIAWQPLPQPFEKPKQMLKEADKSGLEFADIPTLKEG